jgi:hypothetical protein
MSTAEHRPGDGNIRPVRTVTGRNSPTLPPYTAFLSRLIGLYIILVSSAMVLHKERTLDIVNGIVGNPPLLFVVGIMGATAGLAIVLAHNVWSRGALPVLVTLTGWLALLKGMLLMFMSTTAGASEIFLATLRYEQRFHFYMAFSLILGAYLAYSGFAVRKREQ